MLAKNAGFTGRIGVGSAVNVPAPASGKMALHLTARPRPVRVTVAAALRDLMSGKRESLASSSSKVEVPLVIADVDAEQGHGQSLALPSDRPQLLPRWRSVCFTHSTNTLVE